MAVKFEPEKVPEPTPVAKAEPVKAEPKAKAAKAKPEAVARAGGYVDRGDGDGWVIEEEEA